MRTSLEGVQVNVAIHAKGRNGRWQPAKEAKDGETVHTTGTIYAPTRATCATSVHGIDIQIGRRILEGLAAKANSGLDQATQQSNMVAWGFRSSAAAIASAKAADKEANEIDPGSGTQLEGLARKVTEHLNALTLKGLANVGANPVGRLYADLPDPATQTASATAFCPKGCYDANPDLLKPSYRRIRLEESHARSVAKQAADTKCPVCKGPHEIEGGGAEGLVAKVQAKFDKLAREKAGLDPVPSENEGALAKARREVEKATYNNLASAMQEVGL